MENARSSGFLLRDLFWLTLVAGLVLGWWVDRSSLDRYCRTLEESARWFKWERLSWQRKEFLLEKAIDAKPDPSAEQDWKLLGKAPK